jgi:hypothetical protein
MFVGHFAVGFFGKRVAPPTSLVVLFLAAVLCDLLWDVFFTAGIEHVEIRPGITAVNSLDLVDIAWSHGLLTTTIWAATLAAVYFAARGYRVGAWALFAAVLSHWVLDWVSHRPDMPLAPGLVGRYGLGLWNSRFGTLLCEGVLWLGGTIVYSQGTTPRRPAGKWVLWFGFVFFTGVWAGGLNGVAPPSLAAVAIANAIVFGLFVAWAALLDRMRKPSSTDGRALI